MKRRKPQSPDDERFEVIVWGHEGDIFERLWDATFDEAEAVREKYADDQLATVTVERAYITVG